MAQHPESPRGTAGGGLQTNNIDLATYITLRGLRHAALTVDGEGFGQFTFPDEARAKRLAHSFFDDPQVPLRAFLRVRMCLKRLIAAERRRLQVGPRPRRETEPRE